MRRLYLKDCKFNCPNGPKGEIMPTVKWLQIRSPKWYPDKHADAIFLGHETPVSQACELSKHNNQFPVAQLVLKIGV